MDESEFKSLVKVINEIRKDIKEIKNSISQMEQYLDENKNAKNTETEEQLSTIRSEIYDIERKERIRDGHGTLKDYEIERMEMEHRARNGSIFNQY